MFKAGLPLRTIAARDENITQEHKSAKRAQTHSTTIMNVDFTTNPTPVKYAAMTTAVDLNNRAIAAERSGDYVTAEKLYLEAIAIKERGLGTNDPGTAITYNALGELYLTMKRLDDAEKYLTKAVEIRNPKGTVLDAAVSRENLAQLYEARGNLEKAKETRLSGQPDKMVCSHYQVNRSLP